MKRLPPLILQGMHGFGDCLHYRAVLRQLMQRYDVWLECSSVWPFHDLLPLGLKPVYKDPPKMSQTGKLLRTQAKNAVRERHLFTTLTPPPGARRMLVNSPPNEIRRGGSVLAAMCAVTGCDYGKADFRLPVPAEWCAKAAPIIAKAQGKPILTLRQLVDRKEWGGNKVRNPDQASFATLFRQIRDLFFVISIADLVPGEEWIEGPELSSDLRFHSGELDWPTIAAIFKASAMVFTAPGFGIVLAQAVETPVATIFGGYERAYSFSAGARYSPYLGIEPRNPCDCFQHNHSCNKDIDLARAREQLKAFAETAARSAIAA